MAVYAVQADRQGHFTGDAAFAAWRGNYAVSVCRGFGGNIGGVKNDVADAYGSRPVSRYVCQASRIMVSCCAITRCAAAVKWLATIPLTA